MPDSKDDRSGLFKSILHKFVKIEDPPPGANAVALEHGHCEGKLDPFRGFVANQQMASKVISFDFHEIAFEKVAKLAAALIADRFILERYGSFVGATPLSARVAGLVAKKAITNVGGSETVLVVELFLHNCSIPHVIRTINKIREKNLRYELVVVVDFEPRVVYGAVDPLEYSGDKRVSLFRMREIMDYLIPHFPIPEEAA